MDWCQISDKRMQHGFRASSLQALLSTCWFHIGLRCGYLLCLIFWLLGQHAWAAAVRATSVTGVQHAQWQQLSNQIEQLQQEIQRGDGDQAILTLQLQKNQEQLTQQQRHLLVLKQSLSQQRALLVRLQQDYQQCYQRFDQQKQLVETALHLAYRLSFNRENQALLPYFSYLHQAYTRRLNQLQQTLAAIKIRQQAVQRQRNRLQTHVTKQRFNHTQLAIIHNRQQQDLVYLIGQLKTKHNQLNKLLIDRKALVQLLKRLEPARKAHRLLQPGPIALPLDVAFTHLRSKLAWPLKGPLLVHFGQKIEQSELKYTGVLIAATLGQPVHALYQGRVVFANSFRGLGLLMIIDHGHSYLSLYGHNQTLCKKVGDRVNTHELIANAGIPKRQRLPQLYFEIRYNSQPLDPENWCQKTH